MSERMKFDAPESGEEKRTIGELEYTVETRPSGKKRFDFDQRRAYDISFLSAPELLAKVPQSFRDSFEQEGSIDLRDLIARESGAIRTDHGLCIPETELRLGENGLIYFTLPGSGIEMAIRKHETGEDYWVEAASDAERHLEEKQRKKQSTQS
jgi:hypothetical protein